MSKEELKLHIDNRYSVCSKRAQGLSYGSFYDGYMDCYSELKKENAELKEKSKRQSNNYKHDVDILIESNKYKNKICKELAHQANVTQYQLNKAKEIIKEILEEDNYSLGLPKELRLKTEQFISEVEK